MSEPTMTEYRCRTCWTRTMALLDENVPFHCGSPMLPNESSGEQPAPKAVEEELQEDDLIPLTPGELEGLKNPAPPAMNQRKLLHDTITAGFSKPAPTATQEMIPADPKAVFALAIHLAMNDKKELLEKLIAELKPAPPAQTTDGTLTFKMPQATTTPPSPSGMFAKGDAPGEEERREGGAQDDSAPHKELSNEHAQKAMAWLAQAACPWIKPSIDQENRERIRALILAQPKATVSREWIPMWAVKREDGTIAQAYENDRKESAEETVRNWWRGPSEPKYTVVPVEVREATRKATPNGIADSEEGK